jgi:hypothetical protein
MGLCCDYVGQSAVFPQVESETRRIGVLQLLGHSNGLPKGIFRNVLPCEYWRDVPSFQLGSLGDSAYLGVLEGLMPTGEGRFYGLRCGFNFARAICLA